MDKQTSDLMEKFEIDMSTKICEKIDELHKSVNQRFDNLKKVIGDYLEMSSQMQMSSVKAQLKQI